MNDLLDALHNLATADLKTGAEDFFAALGYNSDKIENLPQPTAEGFAQSFNHQFTKAARADQWRRVELLFQLTNQELGGQLSLGGDGFDAQRFESFLFFAVQLEGEAYSRSDLANMAREINKPFPAPVIVLFRYGQTVSLASLHRRENKQDANRDVLDRVVLLKDIRLENPHRAQLEILRELGTAKARARDWKSFLDAWNAVLDISELNKKFYRELSNWFFAARASAKFPDKGENATERGLIRLITRLIFTWFIKERELVPNALFESDSLQKLLKKSGAQDTTYYRAVLQNLFFATLNTEIKERRFRHAKGGAHNQKGDYGLSSYFRYENEFVAPEKWLQLVKNVPFLNGGLFECLDPEDKDGARIDGFSDDAKRQAQLPNFLFWGEKFSADLSDVYDDKRQKAVGVTPLLNLLHSYKFTIDENTPLEEDVALDPELLGKVFENLLASYNPETKTTARKQTGSFYTPREIVGYMVEEALFAYLEPTLESTPLQVLADGTQPLRALLSDTDARTASELGCSDAQIEALVSAIERCTILDPACGSGAFPMGALSKMVLLLRKLDPKNARWLDSQLRAVDRALEATGAERGVIEDAKARVREAFANNDPDYARKLYLIEKCLFGVDIQPVALQIAKLRFFIALIIDQKIDDAKPNRNIRALPNLETKFVAANTLIGLPEIGALTPHELPPLEDELAQVRRKHIAPKTRAEKKKLEARDRQLRGEIQQLMEEAQFGASYITPIVNWNPYDQNASAPFFEPERMFGPELKAGFDIVIGNPPYVRHESIAALKPLVKDYACYAGTADLYVYFFEKSLRVLKNGGVLSFICSNKYFRAGYGAKLRAHLGKKTQLVRLIDFGDAPVFAAIAYPHIIVTRKVEKSVPATTFPALSWTLGQPIDEFESVVAQESFAMPQKNLADSGWQIERADTLDLLQKLRDAGTPLGEYVGGRFYYGIKTGYNEAFVVDRATRDALIAEDASSAEVLKPFLRGRDVKRWRVNSPDLWLIFTRRGIDIEKYPAIKRHLEQFRVPLENRAGPQQWFELQASPGETERFEAEKIVYQEIATYQVFGLSPKGQFCNNKVWLIPNGSRFLLAILNAKCTWYFLNRVANKLVGGALAMQSPYLSQLPIPNATPAQQQVLAGHVETILALKAADASADTSGIEAEIDALVADLYGLDDDEKKLVGIG